jgi:hypothetical protein
VIDMNNFRCEMYDRETTPWYAFRRGPISLLVGWFEQRRSK